MVRIYDVGDNRLCGTLSDRQFDDFAERWFGSMDLSAPSVAARNLTSQLRGTGLEELSRNPLMATMLCQLFAAQADGRLPVGRTRVYSAFVDLLRRRLDDPERGIYQQVRAFGPAASSTCACPSRTAYRAES